MTKFPGDHGFGLEALQEVCVACDGVANNLDRTHFVEREVLGAVDNAHAADADAILNLIFVADDHAGLKFVCVLQAGLIRRTHVVIARIRLVTCGAVFHGSRGAETEQSGATPRERPRVARN